MEYLVVRKFLESTYCTGGNLSQMLVEPVCRPSVAMDVI